MKILALEFSSPQRSVAVLTRDARGATVSLNEVAESGPRATRGPAMLEEVLRAAGRQREEIERVVVGLGPGSYTGIRAAIALAQGWQLARKVHLLGISSAECLAARAQAEGLNGRVNLVMDAQREELYLAAWKISPTERHALAPLRIVPHAEVRELERAGEILVGPEVTRWFAQGRILFPDAGTLAKLAAGRNDFIAGEALEPVYLRATTFVKARRPGRSPDR